MNAGIAGISEDTTPGFSYNVDGIINHTGVSCCVTVIIGHADSKSP